MNDEEMDINLIENGKKSLFLKFIGLIMIGIVYFSIFIFIFQTEVYYMYIIIILNYICIFLNFFTDNKIVKIITIPVFILFIALSTYYYAFSTKIEAKYTLKSQKNIAYDNMEIRKESKYYYYLIGKSHRSLKVYDKKNNLEYKVYYDNIYKKWKIKNITRLEYKIENYLQKKYKKSFTTIEMKEEVYETKCFEFDGCNPIKDKDNYYKIYSVKSNSNNILFEVKYLCVDGKGSFSDNYEEKIKEK